LEEKLTGFKGLGGVFHWTLLESGPFKGGLGPFPSQTKGPLWVTRLGSGIFPISTGNLRGLDLWEDIWGFIPHVFFKRWGWGLPFPEWRGLDGNLVGFGLDDLSRIELNLTAVRFNFQAKRSLVHFVPGWIGRRFSGDGSSNGGLFFKARVTFPTGLI